MAFIPTPNGVKVCMRYRQAGQQVCNVYHVDNGTSPSADDLTAIATTFGDWYESYAKANQSPSLVLEAIEVTDISVSSGAGIEYVPSGGVVGTNGGNPLANSITLAVKLATGFTGRSKRGRSYWPGLTTDDMADANHVTGAFASDLAVVFDHLITLLEGAGTPLSVLSLFTSGLPRLAGVLTHITNALVNTTVDNQRRRLPDRGV